MERREATQAGMVIGDRYSVVAPLARGGFGTVYEAEQITTERRVALKLVAPQAGQDSTEYLLGEARLASRLQSEHIVQVLDAGIDHATGSVFVVMDLLAGSTLADLMEQRGQFDPATVVDYVRQICAGLEKAHTHVDRSGKLAPIVHRDLKPANVFVTRRDNGSALLKILDFGTAKLLSSSATSSKIVRGTPQYMAPEQLAGDRPTPATDIWSLGLVAFELLTGRSYWMAVAKDAPYEALFNELHVLPFVKASQRARELGETVELGPGFDAWFARCIQRDPARRFASASLAADELARAFAGAIQRETSALTGVQPTAGAIGRRGPGFDATTSATWLPEPRPRRARVVLVGLALTALAAAGIAWFAGRPSEQPKADERLSPQPSATTKAPSDASSTVIPAAPSSPAASGPVAPTTASIAPASAPKESPPPATTRPVRPSKQRAPARAPTTPAPKASQGAKPNPYQLR